ncbi:MAG: lactonase family protein [Armatimonadota bacterium]
MSRVYVGTYTTRGSEGLYALELDGLTGELSRQGLLARVQNPSFLALHPRGPWLYAVGEQQDGGTVTALSLEGEVLSRQSTVGKGPCHVGVDPLGEYLACANYGSGSVSLHPLREDGQVEAASDFVQHEGNGPVADRQAGPHAHSTNFDPSGRFLIAADLGIDRLMVYGLDRNQRKLRSHVTGGVRVEPGSGPRHLSFHQNGKWAYLINELSNMLEAYHWDAEAGQLTPLQTISTLPAGYAGVSYCAKIRVHPSGRFVYGSNRGHNSLAIFRVDEASGLLEPLGYVSTEGDHPRHFTISPDGQWLLAGNMNSDNIVIFKVAAEGGLEAVGDPLPLPAPTCLLFGRE